ncbi:uncharacterized protein LOC134767654 isoform X1 [Penaeus indicus]|uniref:uncharacterized protein LOC134767654 isoform X1 n=1 Tax=Penaeus indicus TaxID=29960 RepID=UPI00300D0C0A
MGVNQATWTVFFVLLGLSCAPFSAAESRDGYEGPLLSTFKAVHQDLRQNADGTYEFSFSLPQQSRSEQRDADGKVTGAFAFVDPEGEEVSVNFDADDEGYKPESDALPQAPEDTDDVQSARDEFLKYYEETVKYLEALASDEEDDDDDSSSSEEDDYDDSSSEEDSDEDSDEEDSDEEEEEDDDEEEEEERPFRFGRKFDGRVGRRVNEPSRVAPKAPRGSASFPPVLPSFGRRISSSYDQ